MNKTIRIGLSVYTVLAFLTSCNSNIPNNESLKSESSTISKVISRYSVIGKAEFPIKETNIAFLKNSLKPLDKKETKREFTTKATLGQVGDTATVSLIYPPDHGTNPNKTIATGLTDVSGVFTVNSDAAFNPVTNGIYVLEASKRIGAAGNSLISIRTYIKWNESGWDSMTTPGLLINTKTTALSIIDSYDNSITSAQTIGTIISGTPSTVGSVSTTTILNVANLVNNLLTQDVDPVRNISFSNSKYNVNREPNHSKIALNAGFDCPNCDLKNETLSGNYSNKDLSNALLNSANLSNANFTNANLNGSVLTGATLTGVDFTGATWTNGRICDNTSIGVCNYPPIGEFRVNTYTTYYQWLPSIAMDNTGNFIVTWQNTTFDTYGSDIYAQRYNSSGVAQGSELRVNTYTTGEQRYPSISMDNTGNFIVTWQSGLGGTSQDGSDYGIYAQRYNSSGVAQGSEFKVNSYTTNSQSKPSVAMDNNGNFIVTWNGTGTGDTNYGVFAKRYNSSGVAQGSEFRVNTYTTDHQKYQSIAMDNSGNFVITWTSRDQENPSNDYGIYAQRYNSSGVAQGSEFRVNTYTIGFQSGALVAMDSTGNFTVTWQSGYQDGSSNGVYAQRYNSSGVAQGSEFRVNTYTIGFQSGALVAMDSTGNFTVTWQSGYQDGSSNGVYAQRYNSSGVAQGSEFRVNTYTTGSQGGAPVAMDNNGNFVVTWQSYAQDGSHYGIYSQRYNSSGVAQ